MYEIFVSSADTIGIMTHIICTLVVLGMSIMVWEVSR